MAGSPLPALTPRGPGAQFVLYADACSGVPGALHERTHAAVNAVVARLDPQPEFVVFPGDEVIGLVSDAAALRAQWRHWFDTEMAWLDRTTIPLFNATGNHTTYDPASAAVFRDVMEHLPLTPHRLDYAVRYGELRLIVVDTMCPALGGEGHVDLDWLAATLAEGGARWTFVAGHHPAHAVNGFEGAGQRTLHEAAAFWRLLAAHGVKAYLCSHILAFDVQVHEGVLQITAGGAGTAHRMPEGVEYLHCVQMAVDAGGVRLQVLDDTAMRREALDWPPPEPAALGAVDAAPASLDGPVLLRLAGRTAVSAGPRQTLVCATAGGAMPIWIGLAGRSQQVSVMLASEAGRSPHYWTGPAMALDEAFSVDLLLHPGMGPGGILWRAGPGAPWSSLRGHSATGPERITGPLRWVAGTAPARAFPFLGTGLAVSTASLPAGA